MKTLDKNKLKFMLLIISILFVLTGNDVYANDAPRKCDKIIWLNKDEIWFEIVDENRPVSKRAYIIPNHPYIRSSIWKYSISEHKYHSVFNKDLSQNRRYFLEPTGKREIYFDNDTFHLVLIDGKETLFDRSYEKFRNSLMDFEGTGSVKCTLSRPDIIVFLFSYGYPWFDETASERLSLIYSFKKKRYVINSITAEDNYSISILPYNSFSMLDGQIDEIVVTSLLPTRRINYSFSVKNKEFPKHQVISKIALVNHRIFYLVKKNISFYYDKEIEKDDKFLVTFTDKGCTIVNRKVEDYKFSRNLVIAKKRLQNNDGFKLVFYDILGKKLYSKSFIRKDESYKNHRFDFLISPDENQIAVFYVTDRENDWLENIEFVDISHLKAKIPKNEMMIQNWEKEKRGTAEGSNELIFCVYFHNYFNRPIFML